MNPSVSLPSPSGTSATAAAAAPSTPVNPARIRLWDAPLRLFHWSLVAAVGTLIVTGKLGGAWMPVHGYAGRAVVGLVVFRLVWGVVGSAPARFASFWPTPGRIAAYLRGQWQGVGHNPLGALSVLALLTLLALQASTGLFGNDDIAYTGPLADLVSTDFSEQITHWHQRLANVLYVLLGLHVAAIAFYKLVKKHDLLRPMVTGWKQVPAPITPPRSAPRWALPVAAVLAAVAVYASGAPWVRQAEAAPAAAAPADRPTPAPAAAKGASPSW